MTALAWNGRPPQPEVSGYHWLRHASSGKNHVARWLPVNDGWGLAFGLGGLHSLKEIADGWIYLQPVSEPCRIANPESISDWAIASIAGFLSE